MKSAYAELQVTTNFSFLRGGSHPEELVDQAIALGYRELAITDHNSLAGVVRAHAAARDRNLRLLPACTLHLLDGPDLLAYPTNREAYGRLSGLLSEGNLRTEKGQCHLYRADVYRCREDMLFVAVPPATLTPRFELDPTFVRAFSEYREVFGKDLGLAASRSYQGDDIKKLFRLAQLADRLDARLVATNDVYYHAPERRELQDILTCVREKCTIYQAGFRLHANAERFLKPIPEMHRLFRQYPEAIRNALEIADACRFSLESLHYMYPEEITTNGNTPMEELEILIRKGVSWRYPPEKYPEGVPEKVLHAIDHEMAFIEQKDYAPYFLTVYDLVRFAKENHILCQGRGSAANSTICYCLGITSVNPATTELLFERFISSARNEPPDIDVDFEHERREEVIQYIYQKYGRDRAAIVATVTQVHRKGAIRDVARAMGLSADAVNRLAKSANDFSDDRVDNGLVAEQGFDPTDPHLKKILSLTDQYMGFPRQLGQHTGGFIITRGKLADLCPILNARMENRTCVEWNKDDIEALGFLKIDVLALGMLTCLRKAFDLAGLHYGLKWELGGFPEEDQAVYDMIGHADTIGVFQIESRAQQSMLPRLRPRCFYDLVIEVAIVRPGPIQGDMVHPYLRRRNKEEPVEYPKEELKEILGRTLGVPLFQEQAMKIAMVPAGFTAAEADDLRRSMATFKAHGKVSYFREKLINGMIARGYEPEFAERVFKQLEGFGSYGFPESHAASFALLVYDSSWIKCHYPDIFAAALLNSLPMGFYQPAQIVIDAKKHGVEVRPVDINHSDWDHTLEPCQNSRNYLALRLGFRQVKGLSEADARALVAGRQKPYRHMHTLLDAGVSLIALEKLADADAFRSMGMDRRKALWEVSALGDRPEGLFQGHASPSDHEPAVDLPELTDPQHVFQDYAAMSLSLKAHPVQFVRDQLALFGAQPNSTLAETPAGTKVKVAGLVLVRQRPGTAKGVLFVTLEDETTTANLVLFHDVFEKHRKEVLHSSLLLAEGTLQKEGEVIHVIVSHCQNLSGLMKTLHQPADKRKTEERSVFPEGRNFR